MAELSQETIAIIDRLKAEGDLNRNTGTNSMRSMNIKLDKFDSLFRSINANVIEQTSMLKAQLGVANDAQERARTQEQFDEVTPTPMANQTSDYETSENDKKQKTNAAIDKMGDAIKNAMSLKNLAIGAGAGFVGYNLLKGFIDTKYDGAFTEMEEGLGGFGKELKKFSLDGMNDIKTTITDMNTTLKNLTGPDGSITKLNNNISDLSDRMREIADLGWVDVAAKMITSISAAGALFSLIRYSANLMNDDLNNARKKVGGRTWIQRALGLNKDGYLPKSPVDPKTVKTSPLANGQQGAKNSNASKVANSNAAKSTKPTKLPKAGTGANGPAGGAKPVTPTISTAAGNNVPKSTMRTDAIGEKVPGKGKITMDNGRLRYIDGPKAGQYVNDKDALKALEASLDTKYSKAFGRIVNLFKIVKIAAAIYLMYEIYVILEDDENYPTQNDKIKAMAPILGQIVGGLGGAAIGAAMGSIPPLTGWGTLIGGIGGGFLGAFMGGYLGEIIAKWAFAEQPKQSDVDKNEATLKEGYVRPMPTGQSSRGWRKKYGKTHNKDGSPKVKVQLPAPATPGNRAGVTTGGGGGAKKLTPADLLRIEKENNTTGGGPSGYTPNEILLQEMNLGMSTGAGSTGASAKAIELAAANQAGGINVINHNNPHIAPTVLQQGGSDVTQISFNGSGGATKTDSVFQYGLPNSVA